MRRLEFAKQSSKRHQLPGRERLVGKQQDQVLEKSRIDFGDKPVTQRLRQVDAVNPRTNMRSELSNFSRFASVFFL